MKSKFKKHLWHNSSHWNTATAGYLVQSPSFKYSKDLYGSIVFYFRTTVPLVNNCFRNIMRSFSRGPLWWPILFAPRLGPYKQNILWVKYHAILKKKTIKLPFCGKNCFCIEQG